MTLDIHRTLTDEHGEIDDEAAGELEDELMERFAASPEAQPIIERTGDVGWAGFVLTYGRDYEAVTVTTMRKGHLSRVLLDVFPRKVSCKPSAAPKIVEELRAFWLFLRREFSLANADECLAVLDDAMVRAMERQLANPRNFGMAKSFVMSGTAAGFDMRSAEGIAAFMHAHNASLPRASAGPALSPPRPRQLTQAEKNRKKAARKAERAGRRKGR
jgi:hypothetical protein